MKAEHKIAIAGLIITLITGIAVPVLLQLFPVATPEGSRAPSAGHATTAPPVADAGLQDQVLGCMRGNWLLDNFSSPDFDGDQPNNPQFSWHGHGLLVFNEDGSGTFEINRTVTTEYDESSGWAPIDDTWLGKVTFDYSINTDQTTRKTVITYANERGAITITSSGAGIEPRDETRGVWLVGRQVTCGSDRLELESADGQRVDIYRRA
jgi:hypothetical protein